MYLSKIEMDIKNASVRQNLRDCEDMHRSIQKMFGSSRKEANVLYRILPRGNQYFIYMYSSQMPQIQDKSGMKLLGTKNMGNMKLENGTVYSFSMTAYPSKKIKVDGSKNSRRIFIQDSDEQLAWLYRKSEQGGFRILTVELKQEIPIHSSQKNHNLHFKRVSFMGQLKVIDEELFRSSLENGIGSEKAYGMGMLLLV